jgi:glycine cleavage system H protein
VNEELEEAPELLNEDPYGNWIAIVEITEQSELDDLISADEYKSYCETLE